MSYQVLARKWRPRTFTEMVGQEHVLRAIINALDHDRLHHAFLFAGTRGVGKTTIARILAKSLNCEQGVSSTPCGQCSACTEIDAGRFIDLIEVDAASRTKVEDTRELLDNVQYAPTSGRYKVYLIDEVHMLSKHSFNALLKTLEEPPPHIKFLLATTDPQKLPVTILSRCLQFNLKALPAGLIQNHLAHILKAENIEFDEAAVRLLAHAADGSVRDALSLMDQGIAFGQGRLGVDEMRAMLGTIDRACVYPLLEALAAGDAAAVLAGVDHLAEQAPDYVALLEELISVLHRLALAQVVPAAVADETDADIIRDLAARINAEDIQLFYQIGLIGRRDLPLAPEPRAGLEMVLLRMLAFRPVGPGMQQSVSPKASQQQGKNPPEPRSSATSVAVGTATRNAEQPVSPVETAITPAPVMSAITESADDWGQIVESLSLTGMLKQLAVNCVLEKREAKSIHLRLDQAHAHLGNDTMKLRLEQSLQRYFSAPLKLVLLVGEPQVETPAARQLRLQGDRQQAAEQAIHNDGAIRALQEAFDAQIVPDTIQPLD
jgi:DNA polymerase-3 subunit gamma/tau